MRSLFLSLLILEIGAHFCFAQGSSRGDTLADIEKRVAAEDKIRTTPKPEELAQQQRALDAGIELVDFKYSSEQPELSKEGQMSVGGNDTREDRGGLTILKFHEFSQCYQSAKGLVGLSGNNEITCYSYGINGEMCTGDHVFIYTIKGAVGKKLAFKHVGR